MTLILIWAAIISFAICMYVILDGFDLGIGILFCFVKERDSREIMMSTIVPVWDGNETWLVFGAAALYAAFPIAYSTLLPTLYIPIMIMLAALVFRGVAFEFLFRAKKSRFLWDIAFAGGSIIAAFAQGVILGTFVRGYGSALPIEVSAYQWLTPFSIMTGLGVIAGYALLGSTWLIIKTIGQLQADMYRAAMTVLIIVLFFLFVVSIWTPFLDPRILIRWFSLPNMLYLAPLPICTGIIAVITFFALKNRWENAPFFLSIVLFILAYIGFCISDWPYIIPHAVTIWEAASPPSALMFTLVGVIILMPFLLGYTFYNYRVFRGKVTRAEEY